MAAESELADQDASEQTEVLVNVNMDAVLGTLHRDIQRITNLVAVGIQSPVTLDDDALAIRSESMQYRFGNARPWNSSNQARADYEDWVYGNGFRDAIESVGTFLESVRQVLALWSLGDREKKGEALTGASWIQEMDFAAKKFHRLGFPDKLEALLRSFDASVDAALNEHVLSVTVARNCLVHRRGIVSERDLTCGDALVVSWRRMAVVLRTEDGEFPLVLGRALEKEAQVLFKVEEQSKAFNLGERVVFTGAEFVEVCWSMFLYSHAWGEALNKIGLERGYLSAPEAAPV
ncbi:hypothetical protein J7U46_22490 [Pelomonas sp. V22]|uniref:hypothetical protein n=1 Tax=Pelomonas sp. V22 TaxID=2822139 RepID=UPI0024A8BF46|nr:hypothetical protein [Pelomonas sp. V22]MDI4635852.1 hypothetical protein [Pelomonas sp. V22]